MKEYPKIQSARSFSNINCYAFNKYDGSNLRWEYSRKRKCFNKFGTRTRLFDKTDSYFGSAIEVFMANFSEPLCKLFQDSSYFRQIQEITVFTEFFGKSSFAGQHLQHEPKELVMFDVWIYKYGLMGPKEFIKTFSGVVPTAKLIYNGPFSAEFVNDVRKGKYASDGVYEGVVCKAGSGARELEMCKIKTDLYLEKLKAVFHDKWMNFWE